MSTTIRATFDGEVIRPDEPLSLPPNTRVLITIETTEEGGETPSASFLRTALSLELDGPADWSARLDHYLYGDKVDVDE
jgi:hypothetical protein